MGYPSNTVVTGPISITSSVDTYPTHWDVLGLGGLQSVATITDRNNIALDRRKFGMMVTVYGDPTPANNKTYRLSNVDLGGVNSTLSNNSNWVVFNSATTLINGNGTTVNGTNNGINLGGTLNQNTTINISIFDFTISSATSTVTITDTQINNQVGSSFFSLNATSQINSPTVDYNLSTQDIIFNADSTLIVNIATDAGSAGKVLGSNGSGGVVWVTSTGVSAFTGLSDVPSTYTGAPDFFVKVNNTETGLEFIQITNGNAITYSSSLGTFDLGGSQTDNVEITNGFAKTFKIESTDSGTGAFVRFFLDPSFTSPLAPDYSSTWRHEYPLAGLSSEINMGDGTGIAGIYINNTTTLGASSIFIQGQQGISLQHTYSSGANTNSVFSEFYSALYSSSGTGTNETFVRTTGTTLEIQINNNPGTNTYVLTSDGTFATWQPAAGGGGTGTVTNTGGSLTANAVVLGAGTVDTKVVAGITTNGTSKLILGVAATSIGSVDFKNVTSGTITLAPTTGALGTVTISMPAVTGTILLGTGTTNQIPYFSTANVVTSEIGFEYNTTTKVLTTENLELGKSSVSGGTRNVTINGSDTDVGVYFTTKGIGPFDIEAGSTNIRQSNGNTLATFKVVSSVPVITLYPNNIISGTQDFTVIEAVGGVSSAGFEDAHHLLIRAGKGATVTGPIYGDSGHLFLTGGAKVGTALAGNVVFHTETLPGFGGGEKVIYIADATTNPSTNPSGGGLFFVKSSDHKPYWRTPAGIEYNLTVSAGSSYTTIEDEGTPLTTRATLNIVSVGLTASDVSGKTQLSLNSILEGFAGYNSDGFIVQDSVGVFISRNIDGTTGKITVTNTDGQAGNPTITIGPDIVDKTISNTYSAGMKQIFDANGTNAGINIGSHTAEPSSLVDYDFWGDSTTKDAFIQLDGFDVSITRTRDKPITGTTYLILEEDRNKILRATHASGCTFTIPTGLSPDWLTTVMRDSGAGLVTVASNGTLQGAGTTLNTAVTMAVIHHPGSNIHKLAGAVGSPPAISRSIVVSSGSVTMGSNNATDYIYSVVGAHTMTLPTAIGNTNLYTVKNNYSASITVNTTSSQTIDGSTSITLLPAEARSFFSDNANWSII